MVERAGGIYDHEDQASTVSIGGGRMWFGSDTEALQGFASSMKMSGRGLDRLGAALRVVVDGATWEGADAEAFREECRSVLEGQLAATVDLLVTAGSALDAEAAEQDAASEADGFAAVPPAPPGDDNPFWFWEDGWSAPWSDRADLLDDIPVDPEQIGIDGMGQEGFANCVTVASLGSMAEIDPDFLADHVRRIDDEHYEVDLYIDGQWTTVTVQGDVHESGSRNDGDQNWLTLYEQALIQEGILTETGDYSDPPGAVGVFEAVTGTEGTRHVGRPGQYVGVEPELTYDDAVAAFEEGRPVVLGTNDNSAETSDGTIHLVENHAYAIESVNPDGTITVVNPWGEDSEFGDEDGEYRTTLTPEQFQELFDDGYTGAPPEEWDQTGG